MLGVRWQTMLNSAPRLLQLELGSHSMHIVPAIDCCAIVHVGSFPLLAPPAPLVVVEPLELALLAEVVMGGTSARAPGAKVKHVATTESRTRERVIIETS
jgi:hypothetical protein